MKPIVSIIMGSTSDLPVMEKAAKLLDEMHVPFEMNALSAHRTPEAVENGAMNAAILAVQMLALSDTELAAKFADYKTGLKKKIVKANEELKEIKFEYKTN